MEAEKVRRSTWALITFIIVTTASITYGVLEVLYVSNIKRDLAKSERRNEKLVLEIDDLKEVNDELRKEKKGASTNSSASKLVTKEMEKGGEKFANEVQSEVQQQEEKTEYNGIPHLGDNLHAFVSKIGKDGNNLTVSLRIKNVAGKKIDIAVDEGNGLTTMGGDKGARCVLHTSGVSGISHFRMNERYMQKQKNEYTRLGANQETVVSFFFRSKKWKPIPDNVFTFSSSFLFYNDGDTFYESVGISGIHVD